jgi:hypothetical protein
VVESGAGLSQELDTDDVAYSPMGYKKSFAKAVHWSLSMPTVALFLP